VPLEIRVDSKELPANSNRGLECYFIQAARVSYLPLLVPDIKKFLVDVVLDEEGAKILKEEDWWFEAEDGNPLKWYACTISPGLTCYRLYIGYSQALADRSIVRQPHDCCYDKTRADDRPRSTETGTPSRATTRRQIAASTKR